MPYPNEKDLRVKLNENDIQKIMEWYLSAMEDGINSRTGRPFSAEEIQKEANAVRAVLPKVPAIYLELIQNVLLDNWKTYDKLKPHKPEHPAYHLDELEDFIDSPTYEHEIGGRNHITGNFDVDQFMRMRSTGKHAKDMFERMARGRLSLSDCERAKEYCRKNGYELEMIMLENGELEAEIVAERQEEQIYEMVVEGKMLKNDIKRVAEERERMEAMQAGIEEGDSIISQTERDLKIKGEKLNQNDIDRIMSWYDIGYNAELAYWRDIPNPPEGSILTRREFEENKRTLQELLPKVPALCLEKIDKNILDDKHGYNLTGFRRAISMFENMANNMTTMNSKEIDDAWHYCSLHGYESLKELRIEYLREYRIAEMKAGIDRGDMIMAEAEAAFDPSSIKKLPDFIEDGDAIMAEVEAAFDPSSIKKLPDFIEDGDAIMAEVEAEIPKRKPLSQDLMDMLNGKKELPKNAPKAPAPVKTSEEIQSEAFKKKMVDFDNRFSGVPVSETPEAKREAMINLQSFAMNYSVQLDIDDLEAEK